jgi:hypothetical protein
MDPEPRKRPAELKEGRPEKQGENPASSDSRAFEDPEDGVGKDEAAYRLAWFYHASSYGKKMILQNEPNGREEESISPTKRVGTPSGNARSSVSAVAL